MNTMKSMSADDARVVDPRGISPRVEDQNVGPKSDFGPSGSSSSEEGKAPSLRQTDKNIETENKEDEIVSTAVPEQVGRDIHFAALPHPRNFERDDDGDLSRILYLH